MIRRGLITLSCYLFCLTSLLDPANSIFRLKVPLFLLFLFSLVISYKPQVKYLGFYIAVFLSFLISYESGMMCGLEFDKDLTIQSLIFFLLFISLLWDSYIDLFMPLVFSCLIVSIVTIIGFVIMTSFPEIEAVINVFAVDHGYPFMMSRREFLGVQVVSFFYKSIPVVIFPATYYFKELIFSPFNRNRNIILSSIFLLALFFAGNRTMMGMAFIIFFAISYEKLSLRKWFQPLLFVVFICVAYVGYLSITEIGEESNDIKYAHLVSYVDYFSERWYLIFFGSGAGSLFYSIGFEKMTGITEWTYLEMIRNYGLFGLTAIMLFFTYPLWHYSEKSRTVQGWNALSLSFIFYLIASGTNPYLMSSTGYIVILFMFSLVSNPSYQNDFSLYSNV